MAGSAVRRVVAPTVATAVVTSGAAVAINLATEWKTNPWAWVAVVVATALVAVAAMWLGRRHTAAAESAAEETGGGVSVSHSTIGRDNIQIGRARDVNIGRDRP